MHRRVFLATALAALPCAALAQTGPPPLITPQNELERAFLAALNDPQARPEFRRTLMTNLVALAMASDAPDSAPREVPIRAGQRAAALFTSVTRLNGVLGPASARRIMSGREAFTLLRGRHVVLNYRLAPMLTLEPEDIEAYLAQA